MKTQPFALMTLLGMALVASSLAPAPSDPKSRIAELGKERIAGIEKILQFISERQKQGQMAMGTVTPWPRRLVEAHRQAGTTKSEFIEVVQAYVKTMQGVENAAEGRFKQGNATLMELLEAKDGLLEAKIWLEEARAK